ncbi:MAG: P27 family phage terminase small subunit [Candidatus Thiodiazotropha sp. (ex Gloverina cf. vestifex)]|nr:P27 family phage terminase small subunit [Candidatus Thiodiazotropha sp. (ex Gloverina cf. vestifex)]
MARPRTPTKVLELKGSFKKDPQRKRESEPSVSHDFDKSAPDHLNEVETGCWDELVKQIPAGVLSASDLTSLEIAAKLLAEWREDSKGMATARIARLTNEMGKFGLNPSARASLTVEKPKENPFLD